MVLRNLTKEQKDNLKNICSEILERLTKESNFHKCNHMWWDMTFLVKLVNKASIHPPEDPHLQEWNSANEQI